MNDTLSLWDLYNSQNEMNAILKSHGHDINNITGLSEVAVTGNFGDLNGIPTLVNTIQGRSGNVNISAEDIGAIPSSASCNKLWNWVLKSEQPNYVWGGNEKSTMYIYNPSTFKVSSAVTCETANNSKLLRNRDVATEVDAVNSNITTINNQIEYINTELNNLKQSVVNGKQQIVNAINDKVGYNTGLTANNTHEDYASWITNKMGSSITPNTNVVPTFYFESFPVVNTISYPKDSEGYITIPANTFKLGYLWHSSYLGGTFSCTTEFYIIALGSSTNWKKVKVGSTSFVTSSSNTPSIYIYNPDGGQIRLKHTYPAATSAALRIVF